MTEFRESKRSEAVESPEAAGKRSTDSWVEPLYDELRKLAARKLANEPPGQTLSATALVHEAYMLLARTEGAKWENRKHFYVAAAVTMRRILINRAHAKKAQRRGGGKKPEPLPEDSVLAPEAPTRADELIALDEALEKLGQEDKRKQELVSLRYFVGLTIEQAAEVLGISRNTANRDWRFSRAWLQRELDEALGKTLGE